MARAKRYNRGGALYMKVGDGVEEYSDAEDPSAED